MRTGTWSCSNAHVTHDRQHQSSPSDGAQLRTATVTLTPFHIAVQVRDIAEARHFYKTLLGCTEGRSDTQWVDFNLFGHQFVCHLNPNLGKDGKIGSHSNHVDGHGVPVPHCGV